MVTVSFSVASGRVASEVDGGSSPDSSPAPSPSPRLSRPPDALCATGKDGYAPIRAGAARGSLGVGGIPVQVRSGDSTRRRGRAPPPRRRNRPDSYRASGGRLQGCPSGGRPPGPLPATSAVLLSGLERPAGRGAGGRVCESTTTASRSSSRAGRLRGDGRGDDVPGGRGGREAR